MATITLRPTSGSGSNWSNIGNAYDGNESTIASVSVSLFGSPKTLTLNFDTSVIPSGATINSATLTLRSKAGKTTITANVDINGNSEYRVINKKQSTNATNYTADVTNYMSDLTSVNVVVNNNNWSGNTFELYELWIDVDYTKPTSTTYTVRFLDWDNSVISIQTVTRGGSATPPSNPTRVGYDFTGWSGDYTNVTEDKVITAQYTIKTYTVRFLDWNGTVLDTQTINHGSNATPPPNPTRDGYTFSGWSGNYTNVTADVDIIAQYTQNSSGGDDASVKNIKIGNSTISKLYLGTSQIVKVYLGDVLIFGGSDSGGSGGEITGPETIVENFTPTEDVGWSYRISGINWANHRIKITFDGTNLNTTQGNTLFSLTNEDSDFASTIIDFYSDDGGKLYSYESGSTFSDNVIGQTTMYIDKNTIKVTCNGTSKTTYHSDDAEFQSYMNELKANDTIYIRKNPNEEFANVSNITIVLEDMSNIGGGSA